MLIDMHPCMEDILGYISPWRSRLLVAAGIGSEATQAKLQGEDDL